MATLPKQRLILIAPIRGAKFETKLSFDLLRGFSNDTRCTFSGLNKIDKLALGSVFCQKIVVQLIQSLISEFFTALTHL
jgi:hypothetical protein